MAYIYVFGLTIPPHWFSYTKAINLMMVLILYEFDLHDRMDDHVNLYYIMIFTNIMLAVGYDLQSKCVVNALFGTYLAYHVMLQPETGTKDICPSFEWIGLYTLWNIKFIFNHDMTWYMLIPLWIPISSILVSGNTCSWTHYRLYSLLISIAITQDITEVNVMSQYYSIKRSVRRCRRFFDKNQKRVQITDISS
jgi:hypothetical protein